MEIDLVCGSGVALLLYKAICFSLGGNTPVHPPRRDEGSLGADIQGFLFPWMREDNDPITQALGRVVTTLRRDRPRSLRSRAAQGARPAAQDRRARPELSWPRPLGDPPPAPASSASKVERSSVLHLQLGAALGSPSEPPFPGRSPSSRAASCQRRSTPRRSSVRSGDASSGRSRATPPRSKRARSRSKTRPTTAKTIRRHPIIPRRRASADVHARTNSGRSRSRRGAAQDHQRHPDLDMGGDQSRPVCQRASGEVETDRSCGSTARSPPRSCMSRAVFSDAVRGWCGC